MKKTSNTSGQYRKKRLSRGETIVEVLFATVILSTVIAGAYTLTNRATRIGQSSIERTEAVNHVESATEALRGIAFTRGGAWGEIMDSYVTSATAPDYSDETSCGPTNPGTAFHLDESGNPDEANTVKNGTTDMGVTGSKQWIEAYDESGSDGYVDFHVRGCWLSISGNEVNRTGTVLRLYTGWPQ